MCLFSLHRNSLIPTWHILSFIYLIVLRFYKVINQIQSRKTVEYQIGFNIWKQWRKADLVEDFISTLKGRRRCGSPHRRQKDQF